MTLTISTPRLATTPTNKSNPSSLLASQILISPSNRDSWKNNWDLIWDQASIITIKLKKFARVRKYLIEGIIEEAKRKEIQYKQNNTG
jgi:hypothetical protein